LKKGLANSTWINCRAKYFALKKGIAMPIDSPVWSLLVFVVLILSCNRLARVWPFRLPQATSAAEIPERLTTLDGLRGLLAASVLISHCLFFRVVVISGMRDPGLPRYYEQLGVASVTLFFFVTGFLFWKKLRKSRRIPYLHFVANRLARLGPAHWAACVLFFLLVASQSALELRVPAFKLVAQAASWLSFFGAGHDINALFGSRYWLGQVWTLRLEWCFYLSLPLLGWFARSNWRVLYLFAIAGTLYALLTSLRLGGVSGILAYLLREYARMFLYAFSFGICAAIVPVDCLEERYFTGSAASLLGCAMVALILFAAPPHYGWLESSLLIVPFVCVVGGNTFFGLLTLPGVQMLGRISYSLYLVHSVVIVIGLRILMHFNELTGQPAALFWCESLAPVFLSVALSALWWRVLERPFLHGIPTAWRLQRIVSASASHSIGLQNPKAQQHTAA
jgi:peptidoglycan/LPS O-acetylase OafA/YrhL